ncbi:hypothetical protein [Glycomyces albidus]|uniref:hypothetical protein n=1 Tax=Glycomyces albidus TaxID=2656774 RepID=UPI00128FE9E4|nr:hypothetical protein [Glycomyces albidus]
MLQRCPSTGTTGGTGGRRKPKGSEEGVVHLLEFRDGSTIALGIDAPVAEGEDFLG